MERLRGKFDIEVRDVPYAAAKELVAELDEHLGAHAVLLHQYRKHVWLAPSAELKLFLSEQSRSVLAQLEALGADIVQLGGVPISGPCEQENVSYLESENEGLYSVDAMLRKDLNDEETVAFRLGITVETAAELEVRTTVQVLTGAREAAIYRRERLHPLT